MSTREIDNNGALKSLTASAIQSAISRYNRGEVSFQLRKPKFWYIVDADGTLYPLKNICAIAIGAPPTTFQTPYARRALTKIGIDVREVRDTYPQDFERAVRKSINEPKARRLRLKSAPTKPARRITQVVQFQRNPDVVAEVLVRAAGKCEACLQRAPFNRRSDGSPYLEVHHKILLAHNGDDTVENAIALCPNCHRRFHFG